MGAVGGATVETVSGAGVTLDDVRAAQRTVQDVVKRTPVIRSGALSDAVGTEVVVKAESLQRTGSFKLRGAVNKLASLGERATAGVTAGSAGNHAQAVALAARTRRVPATIFVPEGAAITKIEACRAYGAEVIEGGDSLTEAIAAARAFAEERGMAFCHPFDDAAVVAGQGTAGLEIVDQIDDLSTLVIPLGGGGLAAGVAIAVKSLKPEVTVVGVQAELCAPYVSGHSPDGPVLTLADGIAVKGRGALTGPLIERWLDDIVTVTEDQIADAMVLLMDRAKLVVEGAGAVGVAALLAGAASPGRRGVTCALLSGGNVDLGVVPSLVRRHETKAGRRLGLFARIDDQPGSLARLLAVLAGAGANLIEVDHQREGVDLHVRQTGVHVTLEVRGPDHTRAVLAAAGAAGYADLDLD